MKSVIHLLDENTANKIAAGEVVERPASIVKELVENAIDAIGKNIEIEIMDGGTDYIRVTDDGIGMNQSDAKLAILRHATSKIKAAEDLTSIVSLGFRGEALPSIASVSKFSMTTRAADANLATLVEVHGGKIIDVRDAGGNIGTTVTVSELFYNTPARQKFLKTAATESGYIHNVLSKLAFSHPQISFRLIKNKKLVFATPGTGKLRDTVASLYGYKAASDLLPIEFNSDNIHISGFISKPTILRSNRQWQTFIVNSRIVNSRFMTKSLDSAYHSLLPKSGYPLAIIVIDVPTSSIDVNVHPQKSEIKFSNEQVAFSAVYRAVTTGLKASHDPESIAATVEVKPSYYIKNERLVEQVKLYEEPVSFSNARQIIKESGTVSPISAQVTVSNTSATGFLESERQSEVRPLGQIDSCYIVAQDTESLYVIDQHAAHERILYDRLGRATGRIPAQQMLMPLYIEFDAAELEVIEDSGNIFYELGFTIENIGPNTVRVVEAPADIPQSEIEAVLREILIIIQSKRNPLPQELRHAFLQTAACRAAIKSGDILNIRQMQALINELFTTDLPYTCPHGRPAIIRFSSVELAKMFKRT